MNLQKRFALTLALVTLLALTAAGASAEPITKATFNLPVPAYWNNTLLQPGDYTLSLDRPYTGVSLVYLRGEGTSAVFFVPAGSNESSGHSHLKLEDVAGTYVIREFDEGPLGRSYKFGVPKALRDLTLRGAAKQPATIPVLAAAGQ
jgi:hypothetical protein